MADRKHIAAIDAVGECALLVRLGHGVSVAVNDRVHALALALRRNKLRGVEEIVPAYASLLITFDPEVLPEEEVREHVTALLDEGQHVASGVQRTHVIPVRYGGEDGPDLDYVADQHGLSVRQLIRLHTDRSYRVYFVGFMPGFGYMGRVPQRIATPRLPTPRVRVPAGSVGIAGVQTGIYPFASPGGWQLLGRTARRVWDTSLSEPALFSPGDSVTFVETQALDEDTPPTPPSIEPARPTFRVENPGVMTVVQDLGRAGYAHSGLPQGGAYDTPAATRANALLGNSTDAALLEMTWTGPTLRALHSTVLALDGADLGCRVDGVSVPTGVSWFVRGGSAVTFAPSPGRTGARGYLALLGGVDVPAVLGSRSTYLPASFGGYLGRALWAGDEIGTGGHPYSQSEVAGRLWLGPRSPSGGGVLRFVRYQGVGGLSNRAVQALTSAPWQVSSHSDRMGTRLVGEGGRGIDVPTSELTSFGVVRGAIQLPPDGNPVLLGVDHQTTGGYPLLGVVARVDFPLIGQLRPNDWVSFVEITVAEARAALVKSRRELQQGMDVMKTMA